MKKLYLNKENGYEYEVSIKTVKKAVSEAEKLGFSAFGVCFADVSIEVGDSLPNYRDNATSDEVESTKEDDDLILDAVQTVDYIPEQRESEDTESIMSSLSGLKNQDKKIVLVAGMSSYDYDYMSYIKGAHVIHVFPLYVPGFFVAQKGE